MALSTDQTDREEQIKRDYYDRIADVYDSVAQDDGRQLCVDYISMLLRHKGLVSALDVGCGTGKGMRQLLDAYPRLTLRGVEPTVSLLRQAVRANSISHQMLTCGMGESLPFKDKSFDAVYEVAVLHHVKRPDMVVQEMMRVARKAIFLADNNRFGHGSVLARFVKLGLYKLKLWPFFRWVQTRGKSYTISEGDGLAYSYSVYDSLDVLSRWADQVILIPTVTQRDPAESTVHSWLSPLLTSSGVLLCAFKSGPAA